MREKCKEIMAKKKVNKPIDQMNEQEYQQWFEEQTKNAKPAKSKYINGTLFAVLFGFMVITSIPLCKVIHKATSSNRQLTSKVRWVTSIFALFMFAFLSRAIYDYSTKINGSYIAVFLGLALPLLWDFLPIFLMSLMHYRD
jgi:hypothetical protein